MERSARLALLASRRGVDLAATRVRGWRHPHQREDLRERYLIRSAADVAQELGHMKGVAMKAGQMLSFLVDGLPEPARVALASLQANAPAMSPELARQVITEDLGDRPELVFRRWNPNPVAAASIGQVHRATLRDGRDVAVKVQYPGIHDALSADLGNAELLYAFVRMLSLPNLDTAAVVAELRTQMLAELDYLNEARNQTLIASQLHGHPFISVPKVIAELSSPRVLVTEWATSQPWAELDDADDELRQRAAEVVFRFTQGMIYRFGLLHGDPHPGNFRFDPDGRVTVIDFGLVKAFGPGELDLLLPLIDPLLAGDAAGTTAAMVSAGFLEADHGLDPNQVYAYACRPYVPYLTDRYQFEPGFAQGAIVGLLDPTGPQKAIMEALNMPAPFVILDRVIWGVSALMGRLRAENCWRSILDEYRLDALPATELGERELVWWRATGRR